MFKKLLVAFDGSEGSKRALRKGIELAKAAGVDLHSITVEEELPKYAGTLSELDVYKQEADRYFGDLNRQAEAEARMEGVTLHTVTLLGHEVDKILSYVEEHGFDLLIVGYHGHSALRERIFGSTTSSLVLHAPCSVLIVK